MFRRQLATRLENQAGRLYYDGELFTGIAYGVQYPFVVSNVSVVDGTSRGQAEAWDTRRSRVLFSSLNLVSVDELDSQHPLEGAYLNGSFFDGIAYAFDAESGALQQEQDLHPDHPSPSREWYPSGLLKAEFDRLGPDGVSESETWHENGQSAGVQSECWGFGYTDSGDLITLRLRPDCEATVLSRLNCTVSKVLDLAGLGITDDVVAMLEGLINIENLELDRTSISPHGLLRFSACSRLKKFRARGNTGFGDVDVYRLLGLVLGCYWDGKLD